MKRRPPWYRRWATYRRLTAAIFLACLVVGSFAWFPFTGSTGATRLANVIPFTDPLAAIESTLSTGNLAAPALIGAGILLGAAVLLGPIFCGWVCPLGLALDLNYALRRLVRRRVFRRRRQTPVPTVVPWSIRYAVLGAVLGFALFAGLPAFQTLSPINLLARSILFASLWGLIAIGGLVVLEWVMPRVWCRALCPLGAVYSLVGRFGLLRVRIDPAHAGRTPCRQCSTRCPMGIPVMESYAMGGRSSVTDPGCIRCGDCVDACPTAVLRLGLRGTPPGDDDHPGRLPVVPDGECEDCAA